MEAFWSSFDITMSNEDCELMARLFYDEEEEELQNPSFRSPLMSWSSPPPPPPPPLSPSPSICNRYSSEDGNITAAINGGFNYCANESDVTNHCLVGQQEASIGGIVPSITPSENLNPLEDETTSSCNGTGDYQILRPKRKFKDGGVSSESARRARISTTNVTKRVKNVTSKRAQKRSCDEEDYINTTNCVNSCSYSSEDDSKALQDVNGIGSKRSDQEPSTNPQSLYARRRRERINERLRILQNLVPNGTKVDISTMLEEAVHYVKFLQLQIKLLSSDELWMYAPIAYNGVNIGLDVKVSPPVE